MLTTLTTRISRRTRKGPSRKNWKLRAKGRRHCANRSTRCAAASTTRANGSASTSITCATRCPARRRCSALNRLVRRRQQHGKFRANNEPADPEEKRSVRPEQLVELEKLTVAKIATWANDGRLRDHSKLISILYMWKRLAEDGHEKVATFVESMIADDDGLLKFIVGFESKAFVSGLVGSCRARRVSNQSQGGRRLPASEIDRASFTGNRLVFHAGQLVYRTSAGGQNLPRHGRRQSERLVTVK